MQAIEEQAPLSRLKPLQPTHRSPAICSATSSRRRFLLPHEFACSFQEDRPFLQTHASTDPRGLAPPVVVADLEATCRVATFIFCRLANQVNALCKDFQL